MPTGFSAGPTLDRLISQPNMLRGQQPSQSRLPSQRTQQEINALRGMDEMKAQQMAKQMYRQQYPQSTGLIGMGIDLARHGKKDERLAAFQDQAMTGLTQARTAEDAERNRLALDAMRRQDFDIATAQNTAGALTDSRFREGAAGRQATLTAQQIADSREDRMLTDTPFHTPEGNVVYLGKNRYNKFYDTTGPENVEVNPSALGYTPFQNPVTGSVPRQRTAANRKLDAEQWRAVYTATPFIKNLGAAFLADKDAQNAASGAFGNVDQYLSRLGVRGQGSAWQDRVQSVQVANDALTIEGAAPILDMMGIASDTDIELAFEKAGQEGMNQPARIAHFENTVIPKLMAKAREAGVITEEEISEIESYMMGIMSEARAIHGLDGSAGGSIRGLNSEQLDSYIMQQIRGGAAPPSNQSQFNDVLDYVNTRGRNR